MNIFCTICILLTIVGVSLAFSECENSNVPDPNILGVNNCLQWVAFMEAQGNSSRDWCSVAQNFQKCCLTCENTLGLNKCQDIAFESDCRNNVARGLCDVTLSNSIKLSFFCAKSCGVCSPSLQCASLTRTCNSGNCAPASYFGVQSVQCVCPSNRGGAYCQMNNACASMPTPCRNGGTCTPVYDASALASGASYTCSCTFGYSGVNCQIWTLGCSSLRCYNGGTCATMANGLPYCLCPSDYSGALCQNFVAGCRSSPCQNGATCQPTPNGGYTCLCPNNFSGKTCNYVITNEMCNAGDANSTMCATWKIYNFCDFSYFYDSLPVPLFCPVSCGLCSSLLCRDALPDCVFWASLRLCSIINAQNSTLCRLSCNMCAG